MHAADSGRPADRLQPQSLQSCRQLPLQGRRLQSLQEQGTTNCPLCEDRSLDVGFLNVLFSVWFMARSRFGVKINTFTTSTTRLKGFYVVAKWSSVTKCVIFKCNFLFSCSVSSLLSYVILTSIKSGTFHIRTWSDLITDWEDEHSKSLFCFKVGHFNTGSHGDLLVWWPLEELQSLVLPHWL